LPSEYVDAVRLDASLQNVGVGVDPFAELVGGGVQVGNKARVGDAAVGPLGTERLEVDVGVVL
jgi:hypothetical protein